MSAGVWMDDEEGRDESAVEAEEEEVVSAGEVVAEIDISMSAAGRGVELAVAAWADGCSGELVSGSTTMVMSADEAACYWNEEGSLYAVWS